MKTKQRRNAEECGVVLIETVQFCHLADGEYDISITIFVCEHILHFSLITIVVVVVVAVSYTHLTLPTIYSV